MDNVRLLVTAKANVNQANNDHMTPLYMAAQNGGFRVRGKVKGKVRVKGRS